MQVPKVDEQAKIMLEAVCNHAPQTIIIDEIGAEVEALAARTIAERGVKLIATAHGNSIEELLRNPALNDLLGGVESVTLSDSEARRRGTQKTVLERRNKPTFDVVVELIDLKSFVVYQDVAEAVDAILRDKSVPKEARKVRSSGEVETFSEPSEDNSNKVSRIRKLAEPKIRLFLYGVDRDKTSQAIRRLGTSMVITRGLKDASHVLITERLAKRHDSAIEEAVDDGVELVVLKSNSYDQIIKLLGKIAV